jgi:uncharacterized phage protein gp47/JayE
MAARLLAETELNDVSPGSVMLTILEAASASDFQLEAKLLQLLNVRNIDKASGVDLEALAIEMGLSKGRASATQAKVYLTVLESAFTKVSSNIYAGSSAPVAGDDVIRIVNGTGFSASGTIYIGRGTNTSEVVNYVSITNTGSYWQIALAAPLSKDHLVGEEVVMAQGGKRTVNAGQTVFVEGVGLSAPIDFQLQQNAVLEDGEDTARRILAVASIPGSSGRVGRKKITSFRSPPWSTATVVNESAAAGGTDAETDTELRQRIKDHVHDLAAGTERAVVRAVIGALDDEENKRVVSAYLRKPTGIGQPTILFIDDGTGFQPTFSGIGEEVIVPNAAGTEKYLQLQKWPLVKAQVASVGIEPFNLSGGESLYVEIDGQSEENVLPGTKYRSPGVVTAQEIAENINANFRTIEARAKDGQLFITPTAYDPDYIRIGISTLGTNANGSLRFPVTRQYTVRLYKNEKLLQKNGAEAIIQSLSNNRWTGLLNPASTSNPETLKLQVDGIESSLISFTDLEFATYTSSQKVADATVIDWAIMINKKFIGISATALDDGTFIIKSNRGKTNVANVAVIGGTLATKLFAANEASTGMSPEYKVNRLSGQIELATPLTSGDILKAGTVNTRGFVLTSKQASFDLSATNGFAAEMIIIADAPFTVVPVAQTGLITFSSPSTGVMRLTGSSGQFTKVNDNDCVHIYGTTIKNGLTRVISVATNGSYVDVAAPEIFSGSETIDGVNRKISFFRTEGLTQLVTLPIGTSISLSVLANAIKNQTIGIDTEVLDTNQVKIQTSRFLGTGALAIPSITGTARNLNILEDNYLSNDPHVASIESSDLTGIPTKRYTINADDVTLPYDTVNTNESNFDFNSNNLPILTYLGANSGTIRQPLEKNSNDTVTLRTPTVTQTMGNGKDMKATALSTVELGQSDNMVFLIDNDPAKKTYDVPMYLDATVSGPSVPSSNEFDLIDSTGANLGSSSRWIGHKFQDYRLWMQAKNTLPTSTPNASIKLTSTFFGPNGEHIKATLAYPLEPSFEQKAEYVVEPATDEINITVTLGSSSPTAINLQPGKRVGVNVSGNTIKYSFLPPVDLSGLVIGDLVNLQDTQYQLANRGPVKVTSFTNLTDQGNALQFPTETIICSVAGNTNIVLSAPAVDLIQVGDKLTIGSTTRLITAVTDQSTFTVESPGFTDTASTSSTLTHKFIRASNLPSFTVQAGDLIAIGSITLRVTSVDNTKDFEVDTPFAFTGLQSGTISRITISGSKYNAGTSEIHNVLAGSSVRTYPLNASTNTATAIIAKINGTAGIKDIIVASNNTPSTGAGVITKSTEDELSNGTKFIQLQNGENFIYDSVNASPSIRLKQSIASTLTVGEKVRLVPSTPQNIKDHLAKKQISGLSVAANVNLVDQGRKVQISSKTSGGIGQVFAIGGKASGQNILSVRNNVQEISSDRAQIEIDRSGIDLLIPGNTIKIAQTGRSKKKQIIMPDESTTINIQIPAVGIAEFSLSDDLVLIYPYTQTSATTWAVRNIGRNRIRFEKLTSTAAISTDIKVDDWVLVGNGDSYAGITTTSEFAPANQGWFQIRETDNQNYFDVDGKGVEEFVSTLATSFIFCSYHSARPGDQLVIGFDAPIATANKGTFDIISVTATNTVTYANKSVSIEDAVPVGTNGLNSISVLDQGYISYRKVVMLSPKPSDPTNRSLVIVSPGYDLGLINEGQKAKISLPARLSFGTDPVPGVNGYNYFTGLLRKVNRIVSGYAPDSTTYPGVAAAGVDIEPRPPQINRVSISLKVKTQRGVSLQSISDVIKSAIDSYINSLGLGEDVILSEVVKLVQQVSGVDSCILTYPLPATERITIGDSALAKISAEDIVLS